MPGFAISINNKVGIRNYSYLGYFAAGFATRGNPSSNATVMSSISTLSLDF